MSVGDSHSIVERVRLALCGAIVMHTANYMDS